MTFNGKGSNDKEGFIPVEGGRVYYTIAGGGPKTPLLVLHGGPGFAHDLLRKLDPLGNDRPVIYYDQLGAGKSDRPTDKGLWNIDRFVRELAEVRRALGLKEVILYGASWGTMLAVDYLLTDPTGVKAAILGHPCLSATRWKADTARLLKQLPEKVQATIALHEAAGTTSSQEYQDAFMEFVKNFACRIDPLPQTVLDAFTVANMEVYTTMWGPSEWYPTGNLKDYERVARLGKIRLPVLFLCGRYDEATPESVQVYKENLPGSRMYIIENASHLAYLEQQAEYLSQVRNFFSELGI